MTALFIGSMNLWAQASDKEAVKVVNQAVDKLKKSAVNINFNMNYTSAAHETNQVEFGRSMINGEKFYFTMSGIETFYDGKTQWVYMADINEVTITEPLESELKDINPLAMIQYYMTNHRIAFDDDLGNDKVWFVNFYPHSKKEEYFMVTINISKSSYYTTRIIIYQKNGDKIIFD